MNYNLKIKIVQNNIIWNDIPNNLIFYDNILKKTDDSDLVIFPEVFNTAFVTDISILNRNELKNSLNWIIEKAKFYSTAIATSIIVETEEGFRNRFIFAKPNGSHEFYDKRHIFSMAGENKFIQKGTKTKIVDYKNWKINLQICYDLRFPVWSRNNSDYDLMIYVANWPKSRTSQWKALLIARAIENQSYVIGVNRIGNDQNGFEYSGNSLIINYKGEIIHESPQYKEDFFSTELDFGKLHADRKKFPVLEDRDNFQIID